MQKSFSLGVLLTSLSAFTLTMDQQTPVTQTTTGLSGVTPTPLIAESNLNPNALPFVPRQQAVNTSPLSAHATSWRGCLLPIRSERAGSPLQDLSASFATPATVTHSPEAAAASSADDRNSPNAGYAFARTKSNSPLQASYLSPEEVMRLAAQQPRNPRLLDGETCQRNFDAAQKKLRATQPLDAELQNSIQALERLQRIIAAQRAIVAQIHNMIDAEEPTAREAISNEFAAIARSMSKHLVDPYVRRAQGIDKNEQQRALERLQNLQRIEFAQIAKKAHKEHAIALKNERTRIAAEAQEAEAQEELTSQAHRAIKRIAETEDATIIAAIRNINGERNSLGLPPLNVPRSKYPKRTL